MRLPGGVGAGAAMVVQAALASAVQPVAAGLADGLAAARVLVVGGHVPDRLVESIRIIFSSHSCQFDIKCGGIGDGLQVQALAFDVAPASMPRSGTGSTRRPGRTASRGGWNRGKRSPTPR